MNPLSSPKSALEVVKIAIFLYFDFIILYKISFSLFSNNFIPINWRYAIHWSFWNNVELVNFSPFLILFSA